MFSTCQGRLSIFLRNFIVLTLTQPGRWGVSTGVLFDFREYPSLFLQACVYSCVYYKPQYTLLSKVVHLSLSHPLTL